MPADLEVEIIRDGGDVRYLHIYLTETLWDGKPQRQLVYNDITERKQAEEQLKESENRYHQLVDTITSGVFVYRALDDGEDFEVVDLNNSAEKTGGD